MKIIRCLILIMLSVMLGGCGTTVHVVPEVGINEPPTFIVNGHVEYDGNEDYLPRTVNRGESAVQLPDISYRYNVGYGKDAVPDVLPLFNPLSLVGFPIGADSVVVVGQLAIIEEGKELKKYSSTCVFNKSRSLFYEGDTFSELRKKGLFMVRDNIEFQMSNDRVFLSELQR